MGSGFCLFVCLFLSSFSRKTDTFLHLLFSSVYIEGSSTSGDKEFCLFGWFLVAAQ